MVPITTILVLPDAGPENPFQYLLVKQLRQTGYRVVSSPKRRFFAATLAVRKHRPDAVYFDWIQSFILGKTLLITLLKQLSFRWDIFYLTQIKRLPIVHTLHNMENHSGRWVRLERRMYRHFLRKCTRIRVYSESTRNKVAAMFGVEKNKIMVVQDVPYHLHYPNNVSRSESRNYFKLPPNAFVYLFFGMVKPYKGVETLITAFKTVARRDDYLIIAGRSDNETYARQIQNLAAGHPQIMLHNFFVPESDVQLYYQAADVVVLPFRNIEHSGSIDLAMSFAKPVITRRTEMLENVLRNQPDLLFSAPDELPAIFTAVRQRTDLPAIGQHNYHQVNGYNPKLLSELFQF